LISVRVACAGAIELAILSEHFRLEFAVVDVQTLRVDRFGEQFPRSHAHMVVCDACLQMGSAVDKFLSTGQSDCTTHVTHSQCPDDIYC